MLFADKIHFILIREKNEVFGILFGGHAVTTHNCDKTELRIAGDCNTHAHTTFKMDLSFSWSIILQLQLGEQERDES